MTTRSALLEAFTLWARDTRSERFWGIAKTSDGNVCLLLPSASEDFRAIIISDDQNVNLYLGWAAPGVPPEERPLGELVLGAGGLLSAAFHCTADIARTMLDAGDAPFALEAAKVAQEIARHIDDVAGLALATQILIDAER